jgi:hypothetical protein
MAAPQKKVNSILAQKKKQVMPTASIPIDGKANLFGGNFVSAKVCSFFLFK